MIIEEKECLIDELQIELNLSQEAEMALRDEIQILKTEKYQESGLKDRFDEIQFKVSSQEVEIRRLKAVILEEISKSIKFENLRHQNEVLAEQNEGSSFTIL